jgi:hypothetical protein
MDLPFSGFRPIALVEMPKMVVGLAKNNYRLSLGTCVLL